MFSLVITIISIALVAALALATLYYGGIAFNKGADTAEAAKLVQEANQVAGAFELYRVEKGGLPTGTEADIKNAIVQGGYLKQWPQGDWSLKTDYAVKVVKTEEQCLALNKSLGLDSTSVPSCASVTVGKTVCCSE